MVKIKKYKGQKKEIFSIENPEIISETLSKAEVFINKNKNILFGILSFLVVSFLLFSLFNYYKTNQNSIAQEEMFQAIYYFESDSLVKALNGDGNNYGFLEIIDEFNLKQLILQIFMLGLHTLNWVIITTQFAILKILVLAII